MYAVIIIIEHPQLVNHYHYYHYQAIVPITIIIIIGPLLPVLSICQVIVPAPGRHRSFSTAQHFVLDRYAETVFQGIMPDTGAAKVSTAGKSQFKAL